MTLKTLQEKIKWYSIMHKQNLNGRETEDELFEKGIEVGITETEEMKDDYAIEFLDWYMKIMFIMGSKYIGKKPKELLEIFKKEKGYE